jgi:hypothetical protein
MSKAVLACKTLPQTDVNPARSRADGTRPWIEASAGTWRSKLDPGSIVCKFGGAHEVSLFPHGEKQQKQTPPIAKRLTFPPGARAEADQ